MIRARATPISLDFLPNFYALRENFGDYEHDYLEEFKTGQLTSQAKQVYEASLKNGALDAGRGAPDRLSRCRQVHDILPDRARCCTLPEVSG